MRPLRTLALELWDSKIGILSFFFCCYALLVGNRVYNPSLPPLAPEQHWYVFFLFVCGALISLLYGVRFFRETRAKGDERMWMCCAATCLVFTLTAGHQLLFILPAFG